MYGILMLRRRNMDKNVLRNLSYGVYVITSVDGDRSVGCIANSVMQITSKPATIAVSINHDNYTNGCIEKSGIFVISVLSVDSAPQIIGTFGFSTSKDRDKFAEIEGIAVDGTKAIANSIGYIVCKVINKMETETHTVFLGEVTDAVMLEGGIPMTYAYYHNVIKGKSPKNAPTYIEEEKIESKKKFVCSVCGYVYEGDELPPDFKCPVCGKGAEVFKEQ